ncbi:hypothetical protein HYH03_017855 [Edaphochlamys debaryana]|uniref:Uncharacterized protein n=1 Tax=Edaphochlamys debaryana TaxID=47281 RepID=A0A835XEW6_9CHLO|nr:hypothetical protein HYH03_017855 [Edaphochlamys debaryana]|eukprot:KAG2483257.1 hypothetical protein HYH03_017855 [Edaphochlamys debaryana]
MISYALSLLPSLASLTLNNTGYVPLIPDCVAGRLTHFCVSAEGAPESRPRTELLAPALSRMTALKGLELAVPGAAGFRPPEALQLLDAAPLASLQTLKLGPVGRVEIFCSFANGLLDTVELYNETSYEVPYRDISAVLGTAVLPSRAMGPRLRLLRLCEVEADYVPPTSDPATELYARCDEVQVVAMLARAQTHVLSLLRLLGLPEKLVCQVAMDGDYGIVNLMKELGVGSASEAEMGDGGPGCSSAGSGGGGAGGGRSGPSKPPLVVLTPEQVAGRAVGRMVGRSSEESDTDFVVLRGPLLRGLVDIPRALHCWLERVAAEAGAVMRGAHIISSYRPLPSASAVVVGCTCSAAAKAVAAAARRMGHRHAACGGGGGSGQAMVEAVHSELTWRDAILQVLQALWDGEEESEGAGAAGSAGAEAGAAGGGGSGGDDSGGDAIELQRVRRLLETWQGLLLVPQQKSLGQLPGS